MQQAEVLTKAAVREYFDRDASGYLAAYAPGCASVRSEMFMERRRRVLDVLREPVGRVLDVGAGPGVFAQALLQRGAEVWLADVSPDMMATARAAFSREVDAGRVHCQVADVEHLPFSDGMFDTVLCVGVLQYLTVAEPALRELARVARRGGHVVLTAPSRSSPLNGLHQAAVAAARAGRDILRSSGVPVRPDASRLTFRDDLPNRLFTCAELEALARRAGLRPDNAVAHDLHFPFAIPGLRGPLRLWDRLATQLDHRGWLRSWGREWIIRFERV